MNKKEKALTDELTRRIELYEQLIEHPETLDVDSICNCHMCDLVKDDCSKCILNMGVNWIFECMTLSRRRLFKLSKFHSNGYSLKEKESIRRAAKTRLKEMLKAIDKGGYTYGV